MRHAGRPHGHAARGSPLERQVRRHLVRGRGARRHSDLGHRRRPAGRPVRPGMLRSRDGEEHLRHGELRPPERGAEVPGTHGGNAHDCCVGHRRGSRLCARGIDLRDRRCGAVVARRAGHHSRVLRGGAARRVGARHGWRLCRAGVHRSREPMVGPARTRHHRRHHPRHDEGAHRAGGRGGDGLPDARRDRRDDVGRGRDPRRAPRRRRCVRDGHDAPAPGRRARRSRAAPCRPRDHRARGGIPRGHRGGRVGIRRGRAANVAA